MADSSSTMSSNKDDLVENGKNKTQICCKRCPSLVLSPHQATLTKQEFFLPFMFKKKVESQPDDGETLWDYWLVEDMFTFDNVGFSNTVGSSIKYLICADCEIGPIGWHDLTNKKAYYIAVDRVQHG